MDRGELARGAGLFQGSRAGKGTGLADQGLQVVVQVQAGLALGHQPLVPGDFLAAVVDDDLRGVQHHPDGAADQPHRHRVAVCADADLCVSVHSQAEQPAGIERLVRQRPQQWAFNGEVLADRAGPRPDAAVVVGGVPPLDHRVEFGEGVDFRRVD